ncbi:MAG TPA: CerR family C-terminal domain-containing protein [Terriglobia bacterium]|nr:CerR family C-terminal domain-containing protein [Terriglobia bacterium]
MSERGLELPRGAATEDQETRHRLLDAAARLFAERGFQNVTVRDICSQAGANVAAVNYYFRDKSGLYEEVIRKIIVFMQQMMARAHDAGPNKTAEERLRHYIRTYLQHILQGGDTCWHGMLMAREMADPTPGLDMIFQQAIRPNSDRVRDLISEIMGRPASDQLVGMCVGSVQTQMISLANPIARRFIPSFTPEVIAAIAEHITRFSLGGIRAVTDSAPEVKE